MGEAARVVSVGIVRASRWGDLWYGYAVEISLCNIRSDVDTAVGKLYQLVWKTFRFENRKVLFVA